MTTADLLLLFSSSWVVSALPAAVGVGRIDGRRTAAMVLTLGPFAYFGLALCRRHHRELTTTRHRNNATAAGHSEGTVAPPSE